MASSSSSLMASQTLILQNPAFLFPLHKTTGRSLPFSPPKPLSFSKTPTLAFSNFKPKIFASSSTIPTNPSINSSNTQTPAHSVTLILQNPAFLFPLHKTTGRSLPFSPPKPLSFSKTPTLAFSNFKPKIFASSSTIPTNPSINSSNTQTPAHSVLTESTRTITTLLAITLSVSILFAQTIGNFALKLKGICASSSPDELLSIQGIQDTVVCTMGPLFFAALRSRRPPGSLNTPLTVVAAGMSKWLAIYNGVLLVRVLLSWFPNIPWDRQPLSAIRDLCDPYLNIFRDIIPPLFNTLDISPLMAFAVLGVLSSILTSSTRY